MNNNYRVQVMMDNIYEVIKLTTIYGERLNAYESEADRLEEKKVFQGVLANCEAYIRLKNSGYM